MNIKFITNEELYEQVIGPVANFYHGVTRSDTVECTVLTLRNSEVLCVTLCN
jgi:hypothetical protein